MTAKPHSAPLDGWRTEKLGKLCRIVAGSTPASGVAEYWSGDIVWVTPTDLGALDTESHISGSARRISAAGYESCGTEIVPVGSVVLSSRAPIGHLGIADIPLCTNQGCKAFVPSEGVDSLFLYYALKIAVPALQALGSGATFAEVSKAQLANFEIALPDFTEQRQIAGRLREQLAAVAQARTAVQAQLDAAQALPAAHLRAVFTSPVGQRWPRRRLDELCDLLPSKAIALSGDTEVRAITSACLTEAGFNPEGVKTARMWAAAARESIVSRGEILIARSNTPELVGRVSIYGGEPKGVVASDLTVRLWPRDQTVGNFLASYLSFLFVSGYWKDRAGGASGTMKKITRTQIEAEQVPAPSFAEQQLVADKLEAELAAAASVKNTLQDRLTALDHLPSALLREAFAVGS